MISKKAHPSIEGLNYRYQIGDLIGWCRTKKQAQQIVSTIRRRIKDDKVNWAHFAIGRRAKTTPSLKQSSCSAE